jgi:ribose-phosphate pyrophosphokinase
VRKQRLLFTVASYAYLESAFLSAGDFERGTVERKRFPDGERYIRIVDDVWGRDVVLLGGTPSDLDWLELYDLGYAISGGGARSLSIIMPYFGYSTMERAVVPGEVVMAKTRACLISAIPPCDAGNRVILFDLHADGIPYYFGASHVTHHLYGASVITGEVKSMMGDRPYVLGATDAGRAKWVQSLAGQLGVEPAFVYKRRDSATGGLSVTGINADVAGREVVIYDDMIRTGSSLVQAARAYKAAGATAVHAIASHLVLPADSLARIRSAGVLASIHGTNSHPGSQLLADVQGAVISIAPLLVDTLVRH